MVTAGRFSGILFIRKWNLHPEAFPMNINHAILHVLDFVSCVNVYAQQELDLSSKNAKHYVTGHARRLLNNIDAKRGEFAEDSMFAEELRAFFRRESDFIDLSVQIAEFIAGELGRMEKAESTDVLVIDFEDDPDTAGGLNDADADAMFDGHARRYFAIVLLESRQAYMHEVGTSDTGCTSIEGARHHAILPNPSQKVASFALIEAGSMAVSFCDKSRNVAGEDRMIIPDGLLQCSTNASTKEVLTCVNRIVEEIAEEYGANTAVALSKAKAYVSEAAEEAEELAPWELAEEVFNDEPLRKRFEKAVAEEALPERIPVERKVAARVAKNHKIRTDTGIEITFPAEYGENPDFIEFESTPDGLISIQLKNITHIENR